MMRGFVVRGKTEKQPTGYTSRFGRLIKKESLRPAKLNSTWKAACSNSFAAVSQKYADVYNWKGWGFKSKRFPKRHIWIYYET
jgi:hypothetical protein